MTATTPFCTSAFVGQLYFPRILGYGDLTDFSEQTEIRKSVVDSAIATVDAQIEMALQSAGYYVPLEVLAGETWPDHQTNYLKLLSSLGVAARLFYYLIPNPAANRESENEFRKDYNTWITMLYDPIRRQTGSMLRAKFRPGSMVELNLNAPQGPMTDTLYGDGYYDPGVYASFEQYTELRRSIEKTVDKTVVLYYEYSKGVAGGTPKF